MMVTTIGLPRPSAVSLNSHEISRYTPTAQVTPFHFPRMTISGRRISIAKSRLWSVILTRRNSSSSSMWRTFKLAGMVGGDCGSTLSKMFL